MQQYLKTVNVLVLFVDSGLQRERENLGVPRNDVLFICYNVVFVQARGRFQAMQNKLKRSQAKYYYYYFPWRLLYKPGGNGRTSRSGKL